MITNLFYYDHYRPYILKENKSKPLETSSSKSFMKSESSESEQEFSYFLNKAFKDDIKSYVSKISNSFNSLKNITNYLALKLNNKFEIHENVENSAKQIHKFAEKYNQFLDFYNSDYNANKNFSEYVTSVQNTINENKDTLENIGIYLTSNNKLSLSEDFSQETLKGCSNNILNNLKYVCDVIYQKTFETMKEPLTSYMNFKDFSYYFNYSMDKNNMKTFTLLERGLLVDIEV